MSISSVLITGANRGIGLEFVKQFVGLPKSPKYIFALCRNPVNADELQAIAKSNTNVYILKAEMKEFSSFPTIVQNIQEKVGDDGLNLLINNAGIMFRDSLDELDYKHMMQNFEVNTVLPLLFTKGLSWLKEYYAKNVMGIAQPTVACKMLRRCFSSTSQKTECLPLLKKATANDIGNDLTCSRAAVVNITSKIGSIDDNTSGGCYPYRISKTALNMATRSLAVDLKPHGILVFSLHPGWVLTDMGGSNALVNTEKSVNRMVKVILEATADQAGLMLNYDGKPIPW